VTAILFKILHLHACLDEESGGGGGG
jgi:hypothetical protein